MKNVGPSCLHFFVKYLVDTWLSGNHEDMEQKSALQQQSYGITQGTYLCRDFKVQKRQLRLSSCHKKRRSGFQYSTVSGNANRIDGLCAVLQAQNGCN